jgi:antitoxin StbD
MAHRILAGVVASVLKLNPNLSAGEDGPVAILNDNEPAFYCMAADVFETLMEKLEYLKFNAIAKPGQPTGNGGQY